MGGTLKEETDGHRSSCDPGRGRGHGEEPGLAGTGDRDGGERRQSRRQRKAGRGLATETRSYLRRGFGEGGPGGGRSSRLGLVVDSDLGGGGRGAIRRRRGALVPFRRGVVTAEVRQERGPDAGRPRRPGRSVRVTGRVHVPMPRGPVCENVRARVCVHVDPGKLRAHVCVQTHWKNVTPTCAQVWVPVHPRVKLHVRGQEDGWKRGDTGVSTGNRQVSAAGPALDTVTVTPGAEVCGPRGRGGGGTRAGAGSRRQGPASLPQASTRCRGAEPHSRRKPRILEAK